MDERNPDLEEELSDDELAEAESSSMYDEIAKRWDPSRLLKLVSKRAGKGERLDLTTRQKYEQKLGANLGHVRIYTGEFAREVARQHRAEALTIGSTGMIVMGETADRSAATTEGEALLAHELTHVAQAQRGVHRKGTFGEATPLATEQTEAEAEASEHEARAEAQGGEHGDSDKEHQEELEKAIIERVLQMVGDSERVWKERSGKGRFRP